MKVLITSWLQSLFRSGEQDTELPLDGTVRTRLINMRLRKDHASIRLNSPYNKNFLTKLHSAGSPLSTIRMTAVNLKQRWLRRDHIYNGECARVMSSTVADYRVELQVCQQLDNSFDRLLQPVR